MRLLRSSGARFAVALALGAILALGAFEWRWIYVSWQLSRARGALALGDAASAGRALAALQRAEGIERPDRAELLYQLGRAQRRTANLKEAFAYLRRAQDAGWPARLCAEQIQLGMFQVGRFDQPGPTLNELVARDSSDEFAYELYEALSKGYLHTYRFADALQSLEFWISWRPADIDPRMWRAGVWEQMHRWEQASAEYQDLLERHPDHFEARLALGRILVSNLNRVDDGKTAFQICLNHRPDDIGATLGMAECERRLAEGESAEVRLRALLKRDLTPDQLAGTHMQLGQILLERRELAEAIPLLEGVVKSNPQNSIAQYTLGLAYASDGRRDEAETLFARSRELDERYNRLTDITIILAGKPDQPDLRWEAGQILLDQGMVREGIEWMSTALMYDPNHRQTHESLARYYETVKHDPQLAQRHRAKAREAAELEAKSSSPPAP